MLIKWILILKTMHSVSYCKPDTLSLEWLTFVWLTRLTVFFYNSRLPAEFDFITQFFVILESLISVKKILPLKKIFGFFSYYLCCFSTFFLRLFLVKYYLQTLNINKFWKSIYKISWSLILGFLRPPSCAYHIEIKVTVTRGKQG